MSDSTISNNVSQVAGGGIFAAQSADFAVLNSTISGNSAEVGGGMWATSGARISHSTITLNDAVLLGGGVFLQTGTLELANSVVARNLAPVGRDLVGLVGTTIAPYFSLIDWNDGSGLAEAPIGSPDANGNLIGGLMHGAVNPKLGDLTDNGGPTPTHALLPGSPAFNAGDSHAVAGQSGVPLHDQRGAPFTRVYGGRIDIGAFEAQPAAVLLGDYNQNGVVDAGDYTVWRNTTAASVPAGSGADGNSDGVIDRRDYDLWKSNYGSTLSDLAPAAVLVQSASLYSPSSMEAETASEQSFSQSFHGIIAPIAANGPVGAQRKPEFGHDMRAPGFMFRAAVGHDVASSPLPANKPAGLLASVRAPRTAFVQQTHDPSEVRNLSLAHFRIQIPSSLIVCQQQIDNDTSAAKVAVLDEAFGELSEGMD